MSGSSPRFLRLPLPEAITPDAALGLLRSHGYAVLLESCTGGGRTLLVAGPRIVFRWCDGVGRIERPGERRLRTRGDESIADPFRVLQRLFPGPAPLQASSEERAFEGGWFGYLGYEIGDVLERLPAPPPRTGEDLPTLWWGGYDWAVVWGPDGAEPRLEGAPFPGGDRRELAARMEGVRRLLEAGESRDTEPPPPASTIEVGELTSSLGREGFEAGVERLRDYIRSGDLFQANLTHRLSAGCTVAGSALYRALRARSPAAYAAYIDTGEGEVASISPESFLSVRGRRVRTRPIKGTAPRHPDPDRDRENARSLLESEKERAENVMIVDLLRNDLSRVCRPGSVRVPRLLELESHPSVHHLVSTVEGELDEGVGALDLLRASLPGGSITGAPKIRAMEVLRELEPVRRGVYTGALGVVERGGDLELSIAIRTAVVRAGRAHYGTGCGITLASDPASEWRESLDKAAPFVQALEGFRHSAPGVAAVERSSGSEKR